MRYCNWDWDEGPGRYPGLTDDTRWNGYLNVWVTPDVLLRVCQDLVKADDMRTPLHLLQSELSEGLIKISGYCIIEGPSLSMYEKQIKEAYSQDILGAIVNNICKFYGQEPPKMSWDEQAEEYWDIADLHRLLNMAADRWRELEDAA
jgi:hypothetical protein